LGVKAYVTCRWGLRLGEDLQREDFDSYRANVEVEVLEAAILSGGEAQQAGGAVQLSTSSSLVLAVGVYLIVVQPL
jgi:hypothetical protein